MSHTLFIFFFLLFRHSAPNEGKVPPGLTQQPPQPQAVEFGVRSSIKKAHEDALNDIREKIAKLEKDNDKSSTWLLGILKDLERHHMETLDKLTK